MPFNKVSSKYISKYIAWFKFLQLNKNNKKGEIIKYILINVATKETCITIKTIINRYVKLT